MHPAQASAQSPSHSLSAFSGSLEQAGVGRAECILWIEAGALGVRDERE